MRKDYELIEYKIVNWMKDYLKTSGQKGWVIGVSGGVDSAVASTLAALTGAPTTLLNLPINQEEGQFSRSNEHIAYLESRFNNVSSHTVDLTKTFEEALSALPDEARTELGDVNTASRLRMITLYAFATANAGLVVGTGNRVEDHGVGFFTKYGDGGVDLSPIADLNKTEVRELAEYLGVPASIVSATPTDGLWGDNRSDEEQIGATYEELEWAMHCHDIGGVDYDSLSLREKEVMDIYESRHRATRHKLRMPPVCKIETLEKKRFRAGISKRAAAFMRGFAMGSRAAAESGGIKRRICTYCGIHRGTSVFMEKRRSLK